MQTPMPGVMVETTGGPSSAYSEHRILAFQPLGTLTVTSQPDIIGIPKNWEIQASWMFNQPEEFLLRTQPATGQVWHAEGIPALGWR